MSETYAETVWAPTNEEYHADHSHVSHSMMKQFTKSRRDYHAIYVAGTKAKPEPSDAMNLGTALHCAILEPHLLSERVAFAPECDRRTKDGKLSWQQFQNESQGKLCLPWAQRGTLNQMLSAINRNDDAVRLLAEADLREHSIRSQHRETGLPVKARLDAVITGRPLVLDLKTTRDVTPAAFSRSMATLGYHTQAAWYVDTYSTSMGCDVPRFAFIAVANQEPFSCAVYECHADAIEFGRQENRRTLDALAGCIEYDDWREPHEKQPMVLMLPKWAEYQNDWSLE